MKNLILFKVYRDTLSVSELEKESDKNSLNNTTVINTKELEFSLDYIEKNIELVSSFLSLVIIKNNITTVKINTNNLANTLLLLAESWSSINKVIFKQNEIFSFESYCLLLKNTNIKTIECYELPDYVIEKFKKDNKCVVITRHKYLNPTDFLQDNKFNSLIDIENAKFINLNYNLNKLEIEEFKFVITCTKKLKQIRIIHYRDELFNSLIDFIIENKLYDLTISILDKTVDPATVNKNIDSFNFKKKDYLRTENIFVNYKDKIKMNKHSIFVQSLVIVFFTIFISVLLIILYNFYFLM